MKTIHQKSMERFDVNHVSSCQPFYSLWRSFLAQWHFHCCSTSPGRIGQPPYCHFQNTSMLSLPDLGTCSRHGSSVMHLFDAFSAPKHSVIKPAPQFHRISVLVELNGFSIHADSSLSSGHMPWMGNFPFHNLKLCKCRVSLYAPLPSPPHLQIFQTPNIPF